MAFRSCQDVFPEGVHVMGKAKRAKRQVDLGKESTQSKLRKTSIVDRWHYLMVCALIILVTLAVYWQVTGYEFIRMDDKLYVTSNTHVTAGLTHDSVLWSLSGRGVGNWHPLTWLSLMTDYQIGGMHPQVFHITNILFHLISVLLLILVLSRMTGSFWRSVFVGALFALHPLHVESVAWISERKDVLSAVFWMLTLIAYVRYKERPGIAAYLCVALAFICGLMSKPMLVSLPFVLLLLDYWPLRRIGSADDGSRANHTPIEKLLWEKAPMFALVAASCVITYFAQQEGKAVSSFASIPMGARLSNALVSYVVYICKMFWPQNLAPFYPHPIFKLPVWQVIVSGFCLAAMTLFAVRTARSRPYVIVGWLWYLITLVPVIGIVQVGSQAMADRYTYIPIIGLFIIIAWGVPDLLARWNSGKAGNTSVRQMAFAAVVVLLALTIRTNSYLHDWANDITFWRRVAIVCPNSGQGYYNMGIAYAGLGDMDAAVREYEKAVQIEPTFPDANNNLGNILLARGMIAEAMDHYRAELTLNPNHALAHNNLGSAYSRLGKQEEAESEYRRALEIDPDYVDAQNNIAISLAAQGKYAEAVAGFERVLRLKPDHYRARCSMAEALTSEGKLQDAMENYEEVLRIDPGDYEAQNNYGLVLAKVGRVQEAISHFEEAIRIDPNQQAARINLSVFKK